MRELVITPTKTSDMEVGGFVDDDGNRFVGLSFVASDDQRVIVTFTPDIFRQYAAHLAKAAQAIGDERWWRKGG